MLAGYFGICYYVLPLISLYRGSPLIFNIINLIEVVLISCFVIYFVRKESDEQTFIAQWKIDKFDTIAVIVALTIPNPLLLLILPTFIHLSENPKFDYPFLMVIPTNFIFVWISYLMFRWWKRICSRRRRIDIDWEGIVNYAIIFGIVALFVFVTSFIYKFIVPWHSSKAYVVYYLINVISLYALILSFVNIEHKFYRYLLIISWGLGSIMNGFFPSLLVHDTTLESGICFGVLSLLFSLVLVIIVFSICKLTNSTITMDDWFDAWKSESPRPKKTKEQKVKKVKKEKPLPIPTQKVEVKPLAIKPKNIPNSEFKILWIGAKNNPKFQALQQQGFSIIRLADVNQVNESDFPQKIASVGIVMGYYCGSAKARWQKLISISINECKCRFIMVVEPSKIGEAKVLYADHRYIVIPHTSSLQLMPLIKDNYKRGIIL